jgi:hypothetical protein
MPISSLIRNQTVTDATGPANYRLVNRSQPVEPAFSFENLNSIGQ